MDKNIGDLQNEVREILKSTDKDERGQRIVEMMKKISPVGGEVIAASNDPAFAAGAYFGAFTLIALAAGSGTNVPATSYHEFTLTVMAIATTALIRMEKDEKEE